MINGRFTLLQALMLFILDKFPQNSSVYNLSSQYYYEEINSGKGSGQRSPNDVVKELM